MDFTERRRGARIRAKGPVELWVENGPRVVGTILDVSATGIAVKAEAEIGPGIAVRIDSNGYSGHAIVRNCVAVGNQFRIGMEMVPPG